MRIFSTVFEEGEKIPKAYTCDGENISPPLAWEGLPEGTESLALICDDPDAPVGTWVHWVLFNIPADGRELSENIPPREHFMDGSTQGRNDFRRIGYGGPCPPGGTHRYFFKLYALDSVLDLGPGISKDGLLEAMEGHILERSRLMGRYSR